MVSNRIVGRIKAEIEALAGQNDGCITPTMLVEFARANPLSSLHRCFDWNDETAAEKWRLEQAGGLIRRYSIRIENDTGDTIKIRGFLSLPSDRGKDGTYRSTVRLLSDKDRLNEMLALAKSELAAFRTKYAALQTAAKMGPVFIAIDEALAN